MASYWLLVTLNNSTADKIAFSNGKELFLLPFQRSYQLWIHFKDLILPHNGKTSKISFGEFIQPGAISMGSNSLLRSSFFSPFKWSVYL